MAKQILVVDDEKDVKALFEQRFRKEIRSALLQFNFAFSGEEALHHLKEQGEKPDLVLSDINMPGMSGLDLLQRIKQDLEAPPPQVMMITAYGDEASYRQAMHLGADDFLTKPIDFSLLKGKLQLTA
jgi:two-component system, chemotaxis family, chemotaxis protein CheY